jgi:hypothetical protein
MAACLSTPSAWHSLVDTPSIRKSHRHGVGISKMKEIVWLIIDDING